MKGGGEGGEERGYRRKGNMDLSVAEGGGEERGYRRKGNMTFLWRRGEGRRGVTGGRGT